MTSLRTANLGRRALLAGTTGALTLASANRLRAQSTQGPIKIAVIAPLSGPIGIVGEPAKIGAEWTAMKANQAGGMGGRQIELIIRDDQGKPDMSAAATREVAGLGYNLICGGLASATAMAAIPILEPTNSVFVTIGSAGMAFTHESFSKHFFRTSDNEYQRVNGLSQVATEKSPNVTKWGALVIDGASYVFGAEILKSILTKRHAAQGRKVTFDTVVKTKFGNPDFRPLISALISADIEGLYTIVGGQDCITFWQQASAFGLQQKLKCVIDQSVDANIAAALKKQLPPNLWSVNIWNASLYPDNAIARELGAYVMAKQNSPVPSGNTMYGNLAMQSMVAALRLTGGNTDSQGIIKALESGVKFQTGKGEAWYRPEDHQLLADVNITNTVGADNAMGFAFAGGVKLSGADLVEPASPGKEYTL